MKVKSKEKLIQRLLVGAGLAVAATAAMAQASGATISDSSFVTDITNVITVIADVGGAVISVVVVAWGYKTVKGFIGR